VADRLTEEAAAAPQEGGDIDLMEDEDEAIGDRIMEVGIGGISHIISTERQNKNCPTQDMNGMKEKFDVALKRIGDEIDKDQVEQDEKLAQ
jgi:hypothetical protein